jgi:cell division protein FtsZ
MEEMLKFDLPKNQSSIIKVLGVGGGGSNAVSHMFEQGIQGVDFIICNTDAQSLEISPIPTKIQLGSKGLGAGSIPEVGRDAAVENIEDLKRILEKNTKMLFITAGMGGGTGTGAAPIIAQAAKELDILTVGIVTIPFAFEGRKRKMQAEAGIKELRNYVDSLLIICNDKLREVYGDLKLSDAFERADNILTVAAKGIAEIITVTGYINVDFEDVKTVMKDSGTAIMGSATAEGENRSLKAVEEALSSPLLNDNQIKGSGNILLYIASGDEEITMDEVTEITDYIQQEAGQNAEIIWGNGKDASLGNKISITLVATGFNTDRTIKFSEPEARKIHKLTVGPKEEKPRSKTCDSPNP